MSAVAARTESVDTLAAWFTAHLAAPDTATKTYFTVFDLLEAAGMPHSTENLVAMARAAGRAGLIQARRYVDGALLRAWFRPRLAIACDPGAPEGDTTVLCKGCHGNGKWSFELSEAATLVRAQGDSIKAFLSHAADTYRASLPPVPAPNLDDMADRAREAVRATIEASTRRHSHELHEAVLEYRQASLRVIGAHRRAVQRIMAHMWLQTDVRNLFRSFGMQDFARGGVWSQSTGWLGIGGAAGTLTGQPDRRARPRGARP